MQKPASETLFCFPAIIALCSVSFYIVLFLPPVLPLISARFSLRIIQAVTVLLANVASVSVWFRSKERTSNDMEQDFQFWLHEEWNDSQKMKGRRWRGRKAPFPLFYSPHFSPTSFPGLFPNSMGKALGTRWIFRVLFDSRSSFFATKPHGNARYAGYLLVYS